MTADVRSLPPARMRRAVKRQYGHPLSKVECIRGSWGLFADHAEV
jgi:hypothetical protein